MIKHFLSILILALVVTSCATAQGGYSTKSGKAIKLFQKARLAPQGLDDRGRPDYAAGIDYLNAALDKDPNFLEAHDLISEYYMNLNNVEKSLYHQKKRLSIRPDQDFNGSLLYSIAELEYAMGNYNEAEQMADRVINYPRRTVSPELQEYAMQIKQNSAFASNALKNPSTIKPVNLGPGVNTEYNEYFPTITVDGATLLFTRRIPARNSARGPKEQEDFYVSNLSSKNTWMKATPMPKNINTRLNEGAPTFAPDGRSIVFVACADAVTGADYGPNKQGYGSCDLFFTKKVGQRWLNPINLPGRVNTSSWESQPSLSSDGKTLYFIRRFGRGESSNSDIFVSHKLSDGTWSKADRLPNNINTKRNEESVLIHPDGQTLYFASKGHPGMGGSDLYMSKLQANGTWGNPINLGYPINTKSDENSLLVGPDGEVAFFASNREGGKGGLDIYYFIMPENLRPTKTTYFEGLVYDASTPNHMPVGGKFELIDVETGEQIIEARADKLTGEFLVALPINREYALNVSYPGYAFYSKNFNMKEGENNDAFHMDVPLYPIIAENATIELENVFFDLSKTTLRKESYIELDKLVDFLKENNRVKIEIGGHTDTRGDDAVNQKLSEGRAKAVYTYVLSKGIEANRLSFKGYGESKPKITDAEIAKLSTKIEKEKAHQKNRRTEYKIVK